MAFTSAICQLRMVAMPAQLTVDKAGRIVLPKPLRKQLNLSPGDSLEVQATDEQIVLRPARTKAPLQKERGVWVFRTGEKLHASSVEETLSQVREERDRAALSRSE